jgi:hypothetical protein
MLKTLKSHEVHKRPAEIGLWWAGHMEIMCDDRTVKMVFLGKPDRRIKQEDQNLKLMGVRRWRDKAEGLMGYHSKGGGVKLYGP